MNLIAHFTLPESYVLAGVYLLGVISGAAAFWMIRSRWFQRNR